MKSGLANLAKRSIAGHDDRGLIDVAANALAAPSGSENREAIVTVGMIS